MNKFLGGMVLGLLTLNAMAMEHPWRLQQRWRKEFGDGPAKALERRKNLSPDEEIVLDSELSHILNPYIFHSASQPYVELKRLLDAGADPESGGLLLWHAVRSPKDSESLVNLLLAYGADPHRNNPFGDSPPTQARNIGTLRILLQAGVDISTLSEKLLYTLCDNDFKGDLTILVWALLHHANPNPVRQNDRPLYEALSSQNICKVIALLQYGAQLDRADEECITFLQYAREIMEGDVNKKSRAQYGLLWATEEKHLDPCNLTEKECKAHGISDESTRLIVEAAQKVDKARAEARLADIKYEHGNLTNYVHGRSLGHAGTRKR